MSECTDAEEKLGIKIGKIKMVIPEDRSWSKRKVTLEKRSQCGKHELKVTISGRGYRDEHVYETATIPWEAVDFAIAWLNGGPRKDSSRKISQDSITLKRQMRDVRSGVSLFKTAFNRLNKIMTEIDLEVQVEKTNTMPSADRQRADF